jgi:Peptide chain release factor 1 (eRF1)
MRGPADQGGLPGEGGLDYRLRDKVLAVVSACCANEYGVKEAIMNSQEQLKETEYVKAKELMDRVMYYAVKKSEYMVYGKENVVRAMDMGIAEVVVVAEELGEDEVLDIVMRGDSKG